MPYFRSRRLLALFVVSVVCASACDWISRPGWGSSAPAAEKKVDEDAEHAQVKPVIHTLHDLLIADESSGAKPEPGSPLTLIAPATAVANKFLRQLQSNDPLYAELLTGPSQKLDDAAPGRKWLAQQRKLIADNWYFQVVDGRFVDARLAEFFVVYVPRPAERPKTVATLFLVRGAGDWKVSLDIDAEAPDLFGEQAPAALKALHDAGDERLKEISGVVTRTLERPLPLSGTWMTGSSRFSLHMTFTPEGEAFLIWFVKGSSSSGVFDYHVHDGQIVIERAFSPIRLKVDPERYWEHDGRRYPGLIITNAGSIVPDFAGDVLYVKPVHKGDWPVRRPLPPKLADQALGGVEPRAPAGL